MKQTARDVWKLLVKIRKISQIDRALSIRRISRNSHLLHKFLKRKPVLHLMKIPETVQSQVPDHTVADGRYLHTRDFFRRIFKTAKSDY
jgi:hypothetical protein